MAATYVLETIAHAVEIGTGLPQSWFRGHARAVGELTPQIYRPRFDHELTRSFRPGLELELIEQFRRVAPGLSTNVPADSDRFGWLYLMQHHGVPTRLLDWTANPFVALWFATGTPDDQPGELWALYPQALNRETRRLGPNMPLVGSSPVLEFLIREPYWQGRPEQLAERLGLDEAPRRPIAFLPRHVFPRLVAQWGTFTIHPRPADGHAIQELLRDEKELVRYIVPARHKHRIRRDLLALGVDDCTLFPELDGLSRRLVREASILAYPPPPPPKCGGESRD